MTITRNTLLSKAIFHTGISAMALRKLLAYLESTSLDDIFFHGEKLVSKTIIAEFNHNLELLMEHKPISKIIHQKPFWLNSFYVNDCVLDPRQDSETLIRNVLEHYDTKQKVSILDIGTGSGCLLISLLNEFPNAIGIGIDISPEALAVANKNRYLTQNKNLSFLLADIRSYIPDEKFDIIISNPPYIPTNDIDSLDEAVKKYDPRVALDGGADGLDFYRVIADRSKYLIKSTGMFFLEIGFNQADCVSQIFKDIDFNTQVYNDLNNLPRCVLAKPF